MNIKPIPRIPSSSRLSTLKGLLRNTVTAADRSVINQFLVDGEKELQEFQVEISRLQTAILALEARREGLKQMMEKYRSLLSPIHRMPLEVLTNIFKFYCNVNVLEIGTLSPAMTLSAVCGKWRELTLNTPSLWASLSICYCSWEGYELEPLIQLTQLFMERSKTSPLTLDLDFFTSDFDEEEYDPKPPLAILVQHSSRWYDVRWCFMREQMNHPTFEPLRSHLPMLQYLDIRANDEGNPVDEDDTWDLFSDCPCLHTVTLLSMGFPLSDTILLPWQQITVLTVDGNLVKIFRILSHCPSLRQLKLPSMGKLSTGHLYDVQSQELLSLSFKASNAKDLSFLPYLMAPQLTSIGIQGGYFGRRNRGFDRWDEKPLTGFLARSSCSITILRLQWLPITDTQTTLLLGLMPTLRVLSIWECTHANLAKNHVITPSFLNRLTVDHVGLDTVFLPQLTELEFCVVNEDLDQRALLQMLSSRWLPDHQNDHRADVNCLQSFSLIVVGKKEGPSPECFALLQHFSNSGLRITTMYTHEVTSLALNFVHMH
ncbi:hypothetical protein Moror_10598 [Moniliophthora roreri MCA 2997]|uniref:F-box domain-containing protein n=2 Tax=Moniliophthora roreri TaxID=221103 RepID=V2YJ97_MONRO|nr:hypothetical protein Moror_10598 [Moniliophthora roreri MCA 2997]KAI3613242.1 hypothetical protein WG66_001380 [Moniliophthora roreri]